MKKKKKINRTKSIKIKDANMYVFHFKSIYVLILNKYGKINV